MSKRLRTLADGVGDAVTDLLVDVAPVFEGPLQDRFGHSVAQVPGDVADQPVAGPVVEHLADQGAGAR